MKETQFQSDLRVAGVWLQAADSLYAAAQLVWNAHKEDIGKIESQNFSDPIPVPNINLDASMMMLGGLCLENLIKGIRIQQEPELVKPGELSRRLTNHELLRLLQDGKVTLD